MLRILLIIPACLILTLGYGHDFLEDRFLWYRIHVPGEWIVTGLIGVGTAAVGAVETKLRNLVYGITQPQTWLDRVGDILTFLVLQVILVPFLFVLTLLTTSLVQWLLNH